jgi:hypothetical protein
MRAIIKTLLAQQANTNCIYKIDQRRKAIFRKDDEKNRCLVQATALFFEEVSVKKNQWIKLFYMCRWYKVFDRYGKENGLFSTEKIAWWINHNFVTRTWLILKIT